MSLLGLQLNEWADLATVIGIFVALITLVTGLKHQIRNQNVENLSRYFDAHDKLFVDGQFIADNIKAFESGTFKRKLDDEESEKKFNRFLGDVEKIAFLTSNGFVPTTVQVYMFGWFAQKVVPHINGDERNNIFWELAVHYLDELKKAADDYALFPTWKREKYLKKNALVYKRYRR